MNLSAVIDALQQLEEDGLGDSPVMVLAEGHPPMSVNHIEPETHDEGDGSTTVWFRAEEI